jgi:UPF0716 protein FxsA
MLIYLFLLFTIVPLAELALLIKLGQFLGVFYTILIVVVTGALGAGLARLEGFRILKEIEREINTGALPADKMFDGLIIFCSGLLLLTPGIITDLVGFMGLIPFTRKVFKNYLKSKAKDIVSKGQVITITSFKQG